MCHVTVSQNPGVNLSLRDVKIGPEVESISLFSLTLGMKLVSFAGSINNFASTLMQIIYCVSASRSNFKLAVEFRHKIDAPGDKPNNRISE